MKKVNAYELALRLGVIIEEMEETAKKLISWTICVLLRF